jgi:hypothetical protein
MAKEKTHWLQNPNKNYLGHWDLPNGQDMILTIKTASWEEVKNPIINKSEAKRVVRFIEKVKPFICNEINSHTICESTGKKYMEDCGGMRIKIGLGRTKIMGEEVDCLRVRNVKQQSLEPTKISQEQINIIQGLIDKTDKSAMDICAAYKVDCVGDLRLSSFDSIVGRLEKMKVENNGK